MKKGIISLVLLVFTYWGYTFFDKLPDSPIEFMGVPLVIIVCIWFLLGNSKKNSALIACLFLLAFAIFGMKNSISKQSELNEILQAYNVSGDFYSNGILKVFSVNSELSSQRKGEIKQILGGIYPSHEIVFVTK